MRVNLKGAVDTGLFIIHPALWMSNLMWHRGRLLSVFLSHVCVIHKGFPNTISVITRYMRFTVALIALIGYTATWFTVRKMEVGHICDMGLWFNTTIHACIFPLFSFFFSSLVHSFDFVLSSLSYFISFLFPPPLQMTCSHSGQREHKGAGLF